MTYHHHHKPKTAVFCGFAGFYGKTAYHPF